MSFPQDDGKDEESEEDDKVGETGNLRHCGVENGFKAPTCAATGALTCTQGHATGDSTHNR